MSIVSEGSKEEESGGGENGSHFLPATTPMPRRVSTNSALHSRSVMTISYNFRTRDKEIDVGVRGGEREERKEEERKKEKEKEKEKEKGKMKAQGNIVFKMG